MKHQFCTLFDSNYFSRGLAMYESLSRYCDDFELYIFAFDSNCAETLKKLNLEKVTVITLAEFEDESLLAVKPARSRAEYCWTCTPSTILYVMEKYAAEVCTYLDADLLFFGSPAPLLAELGNNAVIITEHRYTPERDQTSTSGKYNVQFMTFRNNDEGLKVLKWWRDACIDSCELDPAQGKCGDQKYLDDWLTRFEKVHVLKHLGGGVAPWNVQQYRFARRDERVVGTEIATGREFDLVFFHFHAFKLTQTGNIHLTGGGYPIARDVAEHVYAPYVCALEEMGAMIEKQGITFDPHGLVADGGSRRSLFGILWQWKAAIGRRLRSHDETNCNIVYRIGEFKRRFGASCTGAR